MKKKYIKIDDNFDKIQKNMFFFCTKVVKINKNRQKVQKKSIKLNKKV